MPKDYSLPLNSWMTYTTYSASVYQWHIAVVRKVFEVEVTEAQKKTPRTAGV